VRAKHANTQSLSPWHVTCNAKLCGDTSAVAEVVQRRILNWQSKRVNSVPKARACVSAEHFERAKLSRRYGHGQTAVMLVLLVPILLGAIALGSDVAVFYYNWAQLQRAADAAALAGATRLPSNTSGAVSTATQYAELNGASAGEVASITFGNANSTITVQLRRVVPYLFARVLGLVENPVSASATASLLTAGSAGGALPIGLDAQTTYSYGQSITMHQGGVGPGNWDGLALGCSGSSCYRDNLSNGYSGTVHVGDMISSEPGASSGPTSQGINQRISDGREFDSCASWNNFKPGDPRAVIVPIVDWTGCNGRCSVPVKAFASVWINSVRGTDINATFIEMVAPGSTPSATAPDYGTKHCSLTK
jgi:Flp pilus assembly protein TadG